MMNLTSFEETLVNVVLEANRSQHSWLERQLPHLKVKSRELSPVGGYINFQIDTQDASVLDSANAGMNLALGAQKILKAKGTDDFMSFELDIKNGRINFIELVVDGHWRWDGSFGNLELVDWIMP